MLMRFDLSINHMKSMFLDKALIEGKIDRATFVVMNRIGAYIKRTARNSIRKPNKRKTYTPGLPPRNRTGKLKYRIFYHWDPIKRSVIVGPEYMPRMPKNPTIPEVLEYGGVKRGYSKRNKKPYLAVYPAYPYMRPAAARELPKLPRMWRDIIR